MKTTWQQISTKSYPAYSGKISTDVVVVGGGITGISTAYLLAKAGKSVMVVEKEELLQTTTAYTTAFLTSNIDTSLSDLKKSYGLKKTKKIIDAHEGAIDQIEKNIKEEKIECEFTRVSHFEVAFNKESVKEFKEEQKISEEIDNESKFVSSKTLPFPNFGALKDEEQGKFHPLKYLVALRDKAEALGVKFYEHSEAVSIEGKANITVKMKNGEIKAKNVVVATYRPFQEPIGFVWKKGMYNSYVIELEVAKGTLPEMLMEDDANPYHYVRVDKKSPTHDRVIVGGQDHREEIPFNPNRAYNGLKEFIEKKLLISKYKIVTKWMGKILESSDGLALIGLQSEKHDNRYVATAFSGNGMTYGTISSMIIRDLITGKKNPWQEVYDPRRTFSPSAVLRKVRDYGEEFIQGVTDNLSHSKKS